MNDDVYAPKFDLPNSDNPIEQKRGFFSNLGTNAVDFIQSLVLFGAIFAIIYLFIAQPHKVSGSSMVPNFHDGDYILTEKVTYKFKEPQKGDVIVLKNPREESQDFIKRVIAIQGDSVQIINGQFIVNDQRVIESYITPETSTRGGNFLREGEIISIGQDQYFVVGDNRNHSSDSREWGTVTKKLIIGKVFLRYWPPQDIGIIQPNSSS